MKVLIIIDMQNDFITGSLGSKEAQGIVDKIKEKILKNAKYNYDLNIFFTRDTHYTDYLNTQEGKNLPIKHCIFETPGWCIIDELREAANEVSNTYYYPKAKIINKNEFGSFRWEELFRDYGPNPATEIEIVGVCTDICVISNALILKSLFPETSITVDAACCAGTTPEMHQKALDVMKSCQIKVINE